MEKRDLKKELANLYNASAKEPTVVEVPTMHFLMVDGSGDPNTAQAYKDAVSALYTLSYTLKFMVKRGGLADYAVMPLEGLWWTLAGPPVDLADKDAYQWTSMIMQPEYVTQVLVEDAMREAAKKKPLPGLQKVRFEAFHEGRAAQIMHIGPYSEEPPTIEKLHSFITSQGGTLTGKHHEIYLGDPEKSAPDKLRTIIRQPFA
jgi:hypothetical protein